MILFGILFISIIGGLHFYLWKRLISDTRPTSVLKVIGTVLIIALSISIPATIIFSRSASSDLAKITATLPLLWLGTVLFLIITLLLFDCIFFFWYLLKKIIPKNPPAQTEMTDPDKRTSLRKLAAMSTLGLSGSLTTASYLTVQQKPEVIREKFILPKLSTEMHGLKIAQLSDIHIGLTLDGSYLSQIVRQTNALNPDIVAITGDLIDGYVHHLHQEIQPLSELIAPLGVYFVTGNHEYYFKAHEWIELLKNMGIHVLDNRAVTIGTGTGSLLLAGVNDYEAHRFPEAEPLNLTQALANRNPHQEVVLLCHQPKIIQDASNAEIGLILSGHTHGGQIWPFNYLVKLQQPYIKGRIKYTEKTHLYINQGTGYWGPPMRLGTVSEITLITLYSKEP